MAHEYTHQPPVPWSPHSEVLVRFFFCLLRIIESREQRSSYKHLKGMAGVEGTKAKEEQYISDEDGVLLRYKG